jgi:hypothetical protein
MAASTGKTPGKGLDREALAAGLAELAAHPAAGLVTPVLNIPVPPGGRGARILALESIAAMLGTEMRPQTGEDGKPSGVLIAERWFGPVRVEAHLRAPEPAFASLSRIAAGASPSATGSGAAA